MGSLLLYNFFPPAKRAKQKSTPSSQSEEDGVRKGDDYQSKEMRDLAFD